MFAKKQDEGVPNISVTSSGSGGLEGPTQESGITVIQTQPAGPAAAGSCVNDPGPSSIGQARSDNAEPTDTSQLIGKADIQNLTGVMFQILNRLDAQDNKIASLVEKNEQLHQICQLLATSLLIRAPQKILQRRRHAPFNPMIAL
jgi:hypothetical protein